MEEYEKKQNENERILKSTQMKVHVHGGDKESFANSAIMKYGGPKLDIKNAVTILIPAEFLKIDRLVKECLNFIGENIEDISRV
jgi:hypothetical protein